MPTFTIFDSFWRFLQNAHTISTYRIVIIKKERPEIFQWHIISYYQIKNSQRFFVFFNSEHTQYTLHNFVWSNITDANKKGVFL